MIGPQNGPIQIIIVCLISNILHLYVSFLKQLKCISKPKKTLY